jgi:glycerol-3-phosphate acyltransferase PlsY
MSGYRKLKWHLGVSMNNSNQRRIKMQNAYYLVVLLLAYLIGSIPFGLLIVKVVNGRDIRTVQSGRTGGTNAMRAAGFWAGLSTALLDILKGVSGVWISRMVAPNTHWLEVFSGILAILGHNYSIFLIERTENGKLRFRGGAGGTPAAGAAIALWPPMILILLPVGALLLFGVGYASLATMSVPIVALIVFIIRAVMGISPWIYVLYGVLAEIILLWSLRPNIKRLIQGTERVVGWRAKKGKKPAKIMLSKPEERFSRSETSH